MLSRLASDIKGKLWRLIVLEFRSTETLTAIVFALSLALFEWRMLGVAYDGYFVHLRRGEYAMGLGALAIILAMFIWAVIYFRASFTSTYRVRIFYLAIFTVALFFEYGYQNVFGRFSTVEDLRIAFFDATFDQWRDSIQTYISWLAILPCLAYATLLFLIKARRQSSWRILPLLLLILVGFYAVTSPYIVGGFSTLSLNAFFRTAISSPFKLTDVYNGPRDAIATHHNARPQNNIILVVDESVRGDHLSVNGYSRQTTPHLEQLRQQGWLQTWGVAAAGSTCSKASNDMLLTGMGPLDLPDQNFQIQKRPSVFQYAKAMGYRTHYLDGQRQTFWLGTSYDQKYIDEWVPVNQFSTANPNERDADIARKVTEIAGSSGGNFIWVNKYGTHYSYAKRFPPAEAQWQPSMSADETTIDPAKREELINTYDNALRYNLELFFRALDVASWRDNTFLIYTSDHGQTLSEHGERHTHCGATMTTEPTEASVPLLLITKAPVSPETEYLASHANIFPTLLDLMGYPKTDRHYPYELSLLQAKQSESRARYFFVGEVKEHPFLRLHKTAFNGRLLFDK